MTAAPGMVISDLDVFLWSLMEGMPIEPRCYELRVHPAVCRELVRAAEAAERTREDSAVRELLSAGSNTEARYWRDQITSENPLQPRSSAFGSCELKVGLEVGAGCWQLWYAGEMLKSGQVPGALAPFGEKRLDPQTVGHVPRVENDLLAAS